MIAKNSAKFAFVDGIADVFMFLAKFLISGLCTTVCYFILHSMDGIESPFLPLLFIFFLTWVISAVFISIFDTGSNTILQCYLLDKEIATQEGLADPDHIPPTMTKFFNSEHIQEMMDRSQADESKEPLMGGQNQI